MFAWTELNSVKDKHGGVLRDADHAHSVGQFTRTVWDIVADHTSGHQRAVIHVML